MSKKSSVFSILSLLIIFVFACTLPTNEAKNNDPNIVFTAAAETVSAQLTESAIQRASTQTPSSGQTPIALASFTPFSSTSISPTEEACDEAEFVTDVTIPDGKIIPPGESFTKTWRIRNIGTCAWTTGYSLIFENGAQMGGITPQPLVGNVAPGETVDISVNLVAPATNGNYTGHWRMRNAKNDSFAKLYVQIEVTNAAFAVTSVNMSVSGSCGHFTITAAITASKAGEVTYKWIRSDGATDTASHPPVVFASSGTKSVSTDWYLGAAGSHWMDIYIDAPNHQQFGRANFSCP